MQLPVEAERHRVDGHVAAAEVLVERRGFDLRQRPGAQVALAPRAGEVDRAVAEHDAGGAEAVVGGGLPAEAGDRRLQVALHDEIDLPRAAAEEQVADGPAHDVDAVAGAERRERPSPARQGAQGVEGLVGVAHARILAATLASCSRASAAWVGCAGSCSGACFWSSPRAPLPR